MASSSRYAAAHVSPKGAGDARPTAMEIINDEDRVGKLSDKVIILTGGSSGIGIETARALHATGATIYLPVRDVAKGEAVAESIRASSSSSNGKINVMEMKLDSLQSVRKFSTEFLGRSKQLNILINNAGVMATPEGRTEDGYETQFGTNHLGHFLLFELLKPALLASSTPTFNSRVVSLSSAAHRRSAVHFDDLDLKTAGYDPWHAYGQSKTANIYLANEIERRYGSQGLHATSVHPGGIVTPLAKFLDPAIMKAMVTPEMELCLKSPEQGAATTVWAAVGQDWEGRGGRYLEDCSVSESFKEDTKGMTPGYAPHAYDGAAAKRLWELSLDMVMPYLSASESSCACGHVSNFE